MALGLHWFLFSSSISFPLAAPGPRYWVVQRKNFPTLTSLPRMKTNLSEKDHETTGRCELLSFMKHFSWSLESSERGDRGYECMRSHLARDITMPRKVRIVRPVNELAQWNPKRKKSWSERVFVSQRSVHTTDTDLFRRGYRDLRCCDVPVSLIFFVLVAVNNSPSCGVAVISNCMVCSISDLKPRALGGRNSLRTLCCAVVYYLIVVTKTRNIKNIALRLELKTPVIIYIFKRVVKGCIDIEVIAPTTGCLTGCELLLVNVSTISVVSHFLIALWRDQEELCLSPE